MYAIIGATGRTGRTAAETLRSWGQPVRALVRSPDKAADLVARGAQAVRVDLDDPAGLPDALRGVDGLYLMVAPPADAADPVAAAVARGERVVAAAKEAGVPHVVLLSSVGAQHAAGTGPIVSLHRLEEALKASGLPSTFVRASYFAENWGEVAGLAAEQGVLPTFLPAALALPTVDTRDIGRVVAEALLQGPPENGPRVVELAGPRDVTVDEVARVFADVLGRAVQPAVSPVDQAAGALQGMGLPGPVAAMYADMYEGIAAGRVDFEGEPVRGRVPLADSVRGLLS
jgi:uncharacterized protein YbjT (DUF2867 family)